MERLGYHYKIVRLLQALCKTSKNTVRVNQKLTDWFPTQTGVRQGCILSPQLINILLEFLKDISGVTGRGGGQGQSTPSPETSDWEISADIPGRGKMEQKQNENRKREGGKLRIFFVFVFVFCCCCCCCCCCFVFCFLFLFLFLFCFVCLFFYFCFCFCFFVNLKFVDDIVLLASDESDLQTLVDKLQEWSKTFGLKGHWTIFYHFLFN